MSDVRDNTVDDLEAQLVRALHREADAHEPTPPPSTTIRDAARRRDRRRQLELGSAVLVAAALIVVLIVGPWRGNEDAYVDSGPSDAKPQLHLELDPAAGYQRSQAFTYRLDADGRPAGDMLGPEGRTSTETILYSGSDPLAPPWFLVRIRSTENPMVPRSETLAPSEQATTVGGRPARLSRATFGPTPDPSAVWSGIGLQWDEHHELSARFWGVDPAAAADALGTLQRDEAGQWTLGSPPGGLGEVAREIEDTGADWHADFSTYQNPATGSFMSPKLAVIRTQQPLSEGDLVVRGLGGVFDEPRAIERTTVRGRPAIILSPSAAEIASLGLVARYQVLWFEPEHDVIVDLVIYDADRAEADRAIASVREQSDEAWRAALATCTDVPNGGTVVYLPSGASGGPCPGAVLQMGG